MITSILFDCYGTLINTGNGSIQATRRILTLNNCYSVDSQEFYKKWKAIHREICTSEPFKLESVAFRMGLEMLYDFYSIDGDPERDVMIMLDTLGRREIYLEVREVIDKLSKKYTLAIGSNSDHEPLMADLTRNKVNINNIYSSECLRVYKPDVEFFKRMLNELKLKPEEVIYVGDSQMDDIIGPSKLGIQSIWINRNNNQLDQVVPSLTIEIKDLNGILNYF